MGRVITDPGTRESDRPSPAESVWAAAAETVAALPRSARILLTCHVNPDGDALGSMLGFGLGLRQLGFTDIEASFPEPYGVVEPFRFLPGLDLLIPPGQVRPAPDLGISFDAASPGRLGELVGPLGAGGAWLVLDHHASNPGFGTLPLVDPGAAATALVAAVLLKRLGVVFDEPIATCLYVGLSTDTGSFKFEATTPEVHRLAAELISAGLRPAEISRQLFDTRPFGAVRLLGEVLRRARLEPERASGYGLVCAHATADDMAEYDQPGHVLESFIDVVRSTAEADVACLAKPVRPGEWAVSLRSKGAVDVSVVAVALGGGGHRLAAGFTGYGDVEAIFDAVRGQLDP